MDNVQKRYDFTLVFDVTNGNPNGDPDAGNSPRIDPETGHGLVSDVCLKRKVRNYITLAKRNLADGKPQDGYDIYVKEKAVLNLQHQRAYDAPALKNAPANADRVELARKWMCQTFFDIRMFGAVMNTGDNDKKCGQVRGPVQIAFAMSVDPVVDLEQALTRVAVTTKKKADDQIAKYGQVMPEMGRKSLVPYGLYVMHGFFSPYLAQDTGFTNEDLKLLWESLTRIFESDRSAARGVMSTQKLVIFQHDSPLGNAPAHALFRRVKIERIDKKKPARAYADYDVKVDKDNLPSGITVFEL
jgi:CRISPR-associated protein Csd2